MKIIKLLNTSFSLCKKILKSELLKLYINVDWSYYFKFLIKKKNYFVIFAYFSFKKYKNKLNY